MTREISPLTPVRVRRASAPTLTIPLPPQPAGGEGRVKGGGWGGRFAPRTVTDARPDPPLEFRPLLRRPVGGAVAAQSVASAQSRRLRPRRGDGLSRFPRRVLSARRRADARH